MSFYIKLIWFILIFLFGNDGGQHEKKLIDDLFDPSKLNANSILERPTKDERNSIEVRLDFYLIQLIDVDEKNQIFNVNMWLKMKWKDYHFQWDPKLYNGIKRINIPSEKIWKPDLVLYNSADDCFLITTNTQIVAKNSSWVYWVPPAIIKATCLMDVGWFPFDQQHCFLRFGSWTYSSEYIDIKLQCTAKNETFRQENCTKSGAINIDYFQKNNEFDLIYNSINYDQYELDNQMFDLIIVNIGIQRKHLFYLTNLMLPCILFSIMALLVFLLPPDAGEKISLGVTILLAMTMFLLLVAEKLPQTSESIPLISIYFLCIMILCSLSIVFTVLVLNIHHHSTDFQPISNWVKYFINNLLAKLVFMKIEGKSKKNNANLLQERISLSKHQENSYSSDAPSNEMITVADELMKISKKFSDDELKELIAMEWKFAARVIDRYCLIVFSLFGSISTIGILTRIPPTPQVIA